MTAQEQQPRNLTLSTLFHFLVFHVFTAQLLLTCQLLLHLRQKRKRGDSTSPTPNVEIEQKEKKGGKKRKIKENGEQGKTEKSIEENEIEIEKVERINEFDIVGDPPRKMQVPSRQ